MTSPEDLQPAAYYSEPNSIPVVELADIDRVINRLNEQPRSLRPSIDTTKSLYSTGLTQAREYYTPKESDTDILQSKINQDVTSALAELSPLRPGMPISAWEKSTFILKRPSKKPEERTVMSGYQLRGTIRRLALYNISRTSRTYNSDDSIRRQRAVNRQEVCIELENPFFDDNNGMRLDPSPQATVLLSLSEPSLDLREGAIREPASYDDDVHWSGYLSQIVKIVHY